jgi:hypothetical protein
MTYSEKIKTLLEIYGNKLKNDGTILHSRREKPLRIFHISNTSKLPHVYKPEIYYVRKKDRNEITFQVFDTQSKKARTGDVFCAFFTNHIVNAYFIVKTSEEQNVINDLISAIESKLMGDFNADRKSFPTCSAVVVKENQLREEAFKEISSKTKLGEKIQKLMEQNDII